MWGYHLNGALSGVTLCLAMVGIFLVFTVGTLSMVEKARAINLRRGFLCALAPYLRGQGICGILGVVAVEALPCRMREFAACGSVPGPNRGKGA